MDQEEQAHLKKLLHIYERRRRVLEVRLATFGPMMPSGEQLELEDVQKEIARIKTQLGVPPNDAPLPSQQTHPSVIPELTSKLLTEPVGVAQLGAADAPLREVVALVGLAVDLSGSMRQHMRDTTGGKLSRLEHVSYAFGETVQAALRRYEKRLADQVVSSNDLFAYGFGLRGLAICDLLSLVKVVQHTDLRQRVEQLKQYYVREIEQRFGPYRDLGQLAHDLGLGSLVSMFQDVGREAAEAEVRRRILHDIKGILEEGLRTEGDMTLPIEDVARLWDSSAETLVYAEELIYGDTPMYEALSRAEERFKRERAIRPDKTIAVLLVLSDGEPTDGDPLPIAQRMREAGVTIVGCFVTDQNLISPRHLVSMPDPQWSDGATLMFEMTSSVPIQGPLVAFLRQHGWDIAPEARLFIQVNHSDVLEEVIRLTVGFGGHRDLFTDTDYQ